MDEQSNDDGNSRIGRRTVVAGLAVAGLAVGAGVLADRETGTEGPSPSAPGIGGIEPGTVLANTEVRVVSIHPVTYGALPVVLETKDGDRFQVDVLARDPEGPQGVGNTEHYSVYVSNRGDGGTSTDETQGLSAMALARALEAEGQNLPTLMTMRARESAHPGGSFGVPLT